MPKRLSLLLLLLALAACQSAPAPPAAPDFIPFPTMTPGRVVTGALPTVAALPLDGAALANPATAVALANLPTATPDTAQCPPAGSPALSSRPPSERALADEIARFLSAGGAPATLEDALRADWDVLGETGGVRADLDLTGEGVPEVLVRYQWPETGGGLLLLGCAGGRYRAHYQATLGESPPQIVYAGDLHVSGRDQALVSAEACTEPDTCLYETQLVAWGAGRLLNLLGATITGPQLPEVRDVDNDRVLEIIVRQTSRGTSSTGPLRTGVTIYDWNGAVYTRSITQIDPPFFTIQVVHEADRMLARREAAAAIDLYLLALRDEDLRAWFNDEAVVLDSYILYRLVTAYAYAERPDDLLTAYQNAVQQYPDPAQGPPYVAMVAAFWNAFQVTNNMRSACSAVRAIIDARPEALELINRYGSRSPSYTADALCPF